MTAKTREKVDESVQTIIDTKRIKAELAEGERLLVELEYLSQAAEAALTEAKVSLEEAGFDTTKPLEPQLETLKIRAEAAERRATELLADLGARLNAAA